MMDGADGMGSSARGWGMSCDLPQRGGGEIDITGPKIKRTDVQKRIDGGRVIGQRWPIKGEL